MAYEDKRPVCTAEKPAPRPTALFVTRSDPRESFRHPDSKKSGECEWGCCTDYECPNCDYRWRHEWPD